MHIISVDDLVFSWPKSQEPELILKKLHIKQGEKVFISGPSGCGKSTLLSLLTGINTINDNDGKIEILGTDLAQLTNSQRDQFRADHIGYIFQQFNLIPYLTVIENVALACRFSAVRSKRVENTIMEDAFQLLEKLQLAPEFYNKSVTTLSIGQQQRVAAARALIGNPEIIIADEPSSSLDQRNSDLLVELLRAECDKRQSTLLFVSHDERLKQYFDTVYSLSDLNQSKRRIL